jgi:hypothetical protein
VTAHNFETKQLLALVWREAIFFGEIKKCHEVPPHSRQESDIFTGTNFAMLLI